VGVIILRKCARRAAANYAVAQIGTRRRGVAMCRTVLLPLKRHTLFKRYEARVY